MFTGIYNTLVYALYPLVIKGYINKRKKNGKEDLPRFNERIGIAQKDRPQGKLIWMHGASVGESLSMLPLITRLLENYPELNIMVTSGTITSAELMAKRLPTRAFHQYVPIDHPQFVRRFIKHWQPDLALWFESELWPAMLSGIKKNNIPLILVNGRISDKSFKTWQHFRPVCKELLACFSLCLGQSEEDARRLKVLGAKEALCLGNIKYAGINPPVDREKLAELQKQIGERKLWCICSTHDNEEVRAAQIHKKLKEEFPGLLMIAAPRHPHRGPEIQKALNDLGLTTALRSAGEKITPQTDVYIADTIGEVGLWYTLCPITFIGGSLIPHGGQNFMEPSRFRNAVIVGPHMHNFTDAMNRARKADAIIQIQDDSGLEETVRNLLKDKELLENRRSRAYDWAQGEAKVLDGILEKIKGYIK